METQVWLGGSDSGSLNRLGAVVRGAPINTPAALLRTSPQELISPLGPPRRRGTSVEALIVGEVASKKPNQF